MPNGENRRLLVIAQTLAATALVASDPRFLVIDEASDIDEEMFALGLAYGRAGNSMPVDWLMPPPRLREKQPEIAHYAHQPRRKPRRWKGDKNTGSLLDKARGARSRV